MNTINKHLETEGWLWLVLLAAPIVVGVVAAFVVPSLRHQSEARDCVRAGGSYEDATATCSKKVTKP